MSIPEVSSRSRLIAFLKNFFAEKAAAGYAAITGTPVDNQIATWTDSSTIEGNAYLTYDSATGILKAYSTGADAGDWARLTIGDGGDLTIDTSNTYSTTAADINLQPNGKVIAKPNTTNSTTFFQLQQQDGTAFLIADSTNKIVTTPSQPAFLVYLDTDQTLTADTWTTVEFDTEDFDNNSDFASYIFTAPAAGTYVFTANLRIDSIDSSATQYSWGQFRNITQAKNYRVGIYELDNQTVDYWTVGGSVVLSLAASDQVDFQAFVKAGTANIEVGSSPSTIRYNFFSGYMLG